MAFRQFPNADAIAQGALAMQESKKAGAPTTTQGSAAAAKVLAGEWTRGRESSSPQLTSPPPWFAERPFSNLRANNPGQFGEWKRRFDQETFAGFEFRPPPPEGDTQAADSGATAMTSESA
jgi:hypothetical protein